MSHLPKTLHTPSFVLFPSTFLLVMVGLLLVPFSSQGYTYPDQECGFISGISDYAVGQVPDSGRVDFDHGDWTTDGDNPYALPDWEDPDTSTTIANSDRLCFTPEGEIYGENAFAWHTNSGWVDFKWGSGASYEESRPRVDLALQGELADTGYAYWSGYAWNDNIGWIQFDWTCDGCDLTQRVHTILPADWPNSSSTTELVDVEGYAWNDQLGWINFGNTATDDTNVLQDIYIEPSTVYIQAEVSMTPDPFNVNKYGLAGKESAPLADGQDAYEIVVKLKNVATDEYLDEDYATSISVTATTDSHVYMDQINHMGDAISFGDVTYDADRQAFVYPIRSWAPTSSVNGYDEDGDGVIDYYFDYNIDGTSRSRDMNQYAIASIDIQVSGPLQVELEEQDPLWGLTSNSQEVVDLKFVPAIELANLEYRAGDLLYSDYIPLVPYQEMWFDGFLAVWSENFLGKTFDLNTNLKIQNSQGNFDFIFDTNQDDYYLPSGDDSSLTSQFVIDEVGNADLLEQFKEKNNRYVAVENDNLFQELEDASLINQAMKRAMLVDHEDSGSLPDLAIYDVKLDPDDKSLLITLANQGWEDVDSSIRVDTEIYVYGFTEMEAGVTYDEGVTCTLEDWGDDLYGYYHYCIWANEPDTYTNTMTEVPGEDYFYYQSGEDDYFTKAGYAQQLLSYNFSVDDADIRICVDYDNKVNEADETNNCKTINFGEYPELQIDTTYLDTETAAEDSLVSVQSNSGTADVPADEKDAGITSMEIVDSMVTNYFWKDLSDQDFLKKGGTSELVANSLEVGSTVSTCIDSGTLVEEVSEDDNCQTVYLTPEESVLYETNIAYDTTGDGAYDVRYYSNYLSRYALPTGSSYNVPAEDPYKYDAFISGAVTSGTAAQTVGETEEVVVIGDVSTATLRNELFQRFSQLTKGIEPMEGDTDDNQVTGALEPSYNADLLLEDSMIYFVGDTLIQDITDSYDEKTIVIVGGDVFLNSNIMGDSALGIVVFKNTQGEGGNVYINPNVTDLVNVNIYADGSILSYTGEDNDLELEGYDGSQEELVEWMDLAQRRDVLRHQLYLAGSVISQNTIGGYPDESTEAAVLPDGSTTDDELMAREYDLNDLREFVLCWKEVDDFGVPVDQDGDGVYEDENGNPDFGDMESCASYVRSIVLESEAGSSDIEDLANQPIYIKYTPPPASLPLLGGSQAGSVSVY